MIDKKLVRNFYFSTPIYLLSFQKFELFVFNFVVDVVVVEFRQRREETPEVQVEEAEEQRGDDDDGGQRVSLFVQPTSHYGLGDGLQ